ncbi:MAG: NADH-ubiquinone oxidoreductase-F iron-sulfur binding region domain-containing protein [Chloroflexota bacterium]
MITPPDELRLLDGPPLDGAAESFAAHGARLGALPHGAATRHLVADLEASGLLGRGGAGFPVGRKWRALASHQGGRPVIVANGAEGEPASAKDRVLMEKRPHLVLDGAVLAAECLGSAEIFIYVGREHEAAVASMGRVIAERADTIRPDVRLVEAPIGYVAGEATAVVHYVNSRDARPTTGPRMSEKGVDGRPTLVQNVESLAYTALIARFGPEWYRSVGRLESKGTSLVTLSGPVRDPGVREIDLGTPLGEVVADAGGVTADVGAVLLGGYFGTWARATDAWRVALDPAVMKRQGLAFGCGIIGMLPAASCGVAVTADIITFLAAGSARQCGPCLYGLAAIAEATARIAGGKAQKQDLEDVRRWVGIVGGRGACRHPDGAVQMMASALDVFAEDFRSHQAHKRCLATGAKAGAGR